MGVFSAMKAAKALRLQKNGGDKQEVIRLYEEAFAEGLNESRFNLPYALFLIRDGQYQKAREFLVAHQKTPMSPEQRGEMLVYYAVCCFRMNSVDKGISTLEQQFRKTETGLIYQTLGYLYVEKYDQAHKPDFAAEAQAAAAADEAESAEADGAEQPETSAEEAGGDPKKKPDAKTPEEEWNEGADKAEAFIRKSVEYDDEDPVCLDNLGQFIYRVRGDRAAAREWFDKAIALKPEQIDTLYFLSRYDLDAGDRAAALNKLEKAAEGRFSPLNYCSRELIEQEIGQLKGEQ